MPLTLPTAISQRMTNELGPVFVLTFGSLQGDSISGKYSTAGRIQGASLTQIMEDWPRTPNRTIDPLKGRSSIGRGNVTLQNQDGAVEQLLSAYRMKSRPCSLFFLLDGIHWEDRLQIYGGRIGNVRRTPQGTGYYFELTDNLSRTTVTRFKTADIQGESGSGSIRTWELDSGIFGGATLTLTDADSDGVYDTVTLTGHPVNIVLCLLMSGSGEGGDYDVWPAWAGAAMTSDEVDVSAWEDARSRVTLLHQYRITITSPTRVKDIIEQEVFEILGGYPVVTGDGKLSCRFFEMPRSTDSLELIHDDDILSIVDWDGNYDQAVTHIFFKLDHDGNDFQTELPAFVSNEFLLGRVLDVNSITIESKGLQTDLGGVAACKAIADSIFRRYQSPPARVKFPVALKRMSIQAGDVVRVASGSYPNQEMPEPLGIGEERLIEVHALATAGGVISLEGLDLSAPLVQGSRMAVIAPDGQPDYSSASAAQKRYAYLADAADGLLPDGTAGYLVA